MRQLLGLSVLLLSGPLWALNFDVNKAAECRAKLAANLCYTDRVDHWSIISDIPFDQAVSRFQNRTCHPMPAGRAEVILGLYDKFPAAVQAAFCRMEKVFLVRGDVDYGALADYYLERPEFKTVENDWGINVTSFRARARGFLMEISEKNRFKGESTGASMTRVMQARFGHAVAAAGVSAQLPAVEHHNEFGEHGALATTILHEIGHMISRANKVNQAVLPPFSPTEWSRLSWDVTEATVTPKSRDDMDLHYNITSKSVGVAQVPAAIEYLRREGIPTLYAATHPEEEFAEQFMLYFYDQFKIKIGDRVVFDLNIEKQNNPLIRQKRAFIERLLGQPDPYDPARAGVIEGQLE